jgi:hypothetical protein
VAAFVKGSTMTRIRKPPRRRNSHLATTDPLPLPVIESFVPSPVDRERIHRDITTQAAALAPGMDEGTGYALDNYINATVAEWEADVRREYAAHRSQVGMSHARAEAVVKEQELVYRLDLDQLSDTRLALDAARSQLTGRPGSVGRDIELSGSGDGRPGFDADGKPSLDAADWRAADHADAALIAGSPRGHHLHVVALTVAAGADVGAFYQIIARTLQTSMVTIWLVVLGFSATVLYLAHISGVMLRDVKAKARWIGTKAITLAATAWLLLGSAAFMVRLLLPPESSIPVLSVTLPNDQAAASVKDNLPAALIFLSLYIGTGLVAATGAYLTHNPLRAAFAKAQRAYRKKITKAAVSANRLA